MPQRPNVARNIKKYDVVIIGAGIVGATIAREMTRYELKVVVLDKAAELPSGASRANSSMMHAGFDDKPGTMKALLCAKGNALYHRLCGELDFRVVPCGSYVCAIGEREEKHLEMLLEQGKENGVPGLKIVPRDELLYREPNANKEITAALYAPTAAMINNFEAVLAFMDNAQANGAELYLNTEVHSIIKAEDGSVAGVSTNSADFMAPIVINAAGVNSDLFSRQAGDDGFFIRPTRGEYFLMDKNIGHLVTSFLFSCPSEHGKGITVARTAEDNIILGPTSTVQADRDYVGTTKAGLDEVYEGALRLVPSLPRNMAITTFAGIRANTASGDFYINAPKSTRGFVNAAGIKSPGLTSAPAIALYVAQLIREELSDRIVLKPKYDFNPTRFGMVRFSELPIEEKAKLAALDPDFAQIVCRCETVTKAQVLEAIRRGARTLAAVKIWTRAGAGRCQGGFCGPRVVEILASELGISPEEVTRHGGHSNFLVGPTKSYWFRGNLS